MTPMFCNQLSKLLKTNSLRGFLKDVVSEYSSPGRHYHNYDHIYKCLKEAERRSDEFDDLPTALWAIFFHDIVYIPGDSENERLSGAFAREFLIEANVSESQGKEDRERAYNMAHRVEQLILDTRHVGEAFCKDAALICDIDLMGLADPWPEFEISYRDIRLEYLSKFSGRDFKQGRLKWIYDMLARDSIFQTPVFAALEEDARENLKSQALLIEKSFTPSS